MLSFQWLLVGVLPCALSGVILYHKNRKKFHIDSEHWSLGDSTSRWEDLDKIQFCSRDHIYLKDASGAEHQPTLLRNRSQRQAITELIKTNLKDKKISFEVVHKFNWTALAYVCIYLFALLLLPREADFVFERMAVNGRPTYLMNIPLALGADPDYPMLRAISRAQADQVIFLLEKGAKPLEGDARKGLTYTISYSPKQKEDALRIRAAMEERGFPIHIEPSPFYEHETQDDEP